MRTIQSIAKQKFDDLEDGFNLSYIYTHGIFKKLGAKAAFDSVFKDLYALDNSVYLIYEESDSGDLKRFNDKEYKLRDVVAIYSEGLFTEFSHIREVLKLVITGEYIENPWRIWRVK
jgi:hypothetical protein